MSNCRYDLSEDCNNKDCLACVLNKIRAEIKEEERVEHIPEDVNMWHYIRALDRTLSIIDKYMAEGSEE